ncbi:MAG: hypothetical protein ABI388_11685 [Bacteroidia bacterium]
MKTTIKTTAGQTAKVIATLFVACGLIFSSCTKDGATGPQGLAGTNGTNGTNGNANVQSYTVAISPSQWTYFPNSSGSQWQYTVSSAFVPSGSAVCVYNNPGQMLPYYDGIFGAFWGVNIVGDVQILYYNGTTTLAAPALTQNLTIVVIPPAMVKPNVNTHNYAEVKAAYNL